MHAHEHIQLYACTHPTVALYHTGAVMITAIPNTGIKQSITEPTVKLVGHEKRVNVVHWHPTAYNIIGSGSADATLQVRERRRGNQGGREGVCVDWVNVVWTCSETDTYVDAVFL